MKTAHKPWMTAAGLALALAVSSSPAGEAPGPSGKNGGRGQPAGDPTFFRTEVPASRGNVVLGRPTDGAITLSVLLHSGVKIKVAYGLAGQALARRTAVFDIKAGEPREIQLSGLATNAAYEYRILAAASGEPLLPEKGNGSFHTGRAPGSPFCFTLQADSHLDGNCDPKLYTATLANALADKPDFHIDLGDTFMTEKHASRDTAFKQYLAQRHYFGQLCQSAPLFLVLGNHDGENLRGRGNESDSLPVWSNTMRKRFFPNPVPDGFYTGDATKRADAGLLQDYYAWTRGDALFVVLDPYWTSRATRGGSVPWNMTIGKAQYDWLARTLRTSTAKHKFVFIHQLTGGLDKGGRGGAEAAVLYEWGGHELDGTDTFAANRPGWGEPIHALLVETGVSAVFHGHDHLFAKQELDGIVYQEVPQPGAPNADARSAAEYGYKSGVIFGGSGHLRVAVSAKESTVEYVRTDGTVAHAYTVPAGIRK